MLMRALKCDANSWFNPRDVGESKTATLVVVEVIPHSDIAREDLPARQMLDIQMIVVVDGKERSPVSRRSPLYRMQGLASFHD